MLGLSTPKSFQIRRFPLYQGKLSGHYPFLRVVNKPVDAQLMRPWRPISQHYAGLRHHQDSVMLVLGSVSSPDLVLLNDRGANVDFGYIRE